MGGCGLGWTGRGCWLEVGKCGAGASKISQIPAGWSGSGLNFAAAGRDRTKISTRAGLYPGHNNILEVVCRCLFCCQKQNIFAP